MISLGFVYTYVNELYKPLWVAGRLESFKFLSPFKMRSLRASASTAISISASCARADLFAIISMADWPYPRPDPKVGAVIFRGTALPLCKWFVVSNIVTIAYHVERWRCRSDEIQATCIIERWFKNKTKNSIDSELQAYVLKLRRKSWHCTEYTAVFQLIAVQMFILTSFRFHITNSKLMEPEWDLSGRNRVKKETKERILMFILWTAVDKPVDCKSRSLIYCFFGPVIINDLMSNIPSGIIFIPFGGRSCERVTVPSMLPPKIPVSPFDESILPDNPSCLSGWSQ